MVISEVSLKLCFLSAPLHSRFLQALIIPGSLTLTSFFQHSSSCPVPALVTSLSAHLMSVSACTRSAYVLSTSADEEASKASTLPPTSHILIAAVPMLFRHAHALGGLSRPSLC